MKLSSGRFLAITCFVSLSCVAIAKSKLLKSKENPITALINGLTGDDDDGDKKTVGEMSLLKPFKTVLEKLKKFHKLVKMAKKAGFDDFANFFRKNRTEGVIDFALAKGFGSFRKVFNGFVARFNRTYQAEDLPFRKLNLLISLKKVEKFAQKTWQMGINSLADKTPLEYSNMLGALIPAEEYDADLFADGKPKPPGGAQSTEEEKREVDDILSYEQTKKYIDDIKKQFGGQLPRSFDWRRRGVVLPPTEQGECMTCWAFSALAAIESQFAIKFGSGNLKRLSTQQLLDCTEAKSCHKGYWPGKAIRYLVDKQNGKIASMKSYPYDPSNPTKGECRESNDNPAYVIDLVKFPQNLTEEDLMWILMGRGPVIVIMQFDAFQLYERGIVFEDDCKSQNTHAVTLVGWGVDEANGYSPYWTIKNSFGTDWGEDGYLRVGRGADVCHLTRFSMIPVIVEKDRVKAKDESDKSNSTAPGGLLSFLG